MVEEKLKTLQEIDCWLVERIGELFGDQFRQDRNVIPRLEALETNKGNYKLYISAVKIGVSDADVNNYIDQRLLIGMKYTGATILQTNDTDITSASDNEWTFTADDCSSYDEMAVRFTTAENASAALDVNTVLVKYYYA